MPHKTKNHDNHTPATTAVIYVRIASGAAQDRDDIYPQRDQCRQRADRLNAMVVREFIDCGISGITLDRPGLRAMLQYLADHRVDYVIAKDRARISRRVDQQAALTEMLDTFGVQIEVADTVALAEPLKTGHFVAARNFPVTGNRADQKVEEPQLRRIAVHCFHKLNSVVYRIANRLIQYLHLRIAQVLDMEIFQRVANLHRNHYSLALPRRQFTKFLMSHTRSIISRTALSTKHTDPPNNIRESGAHLRSEASR